MGEREQRNALADKLGWATRHGRQLLPWLQELVDDHDVTVWGIGCRRCVTIDRGSRLTSDRFGFWPEGAYWRIKWSNVSLFEADDCLHVVPPWIYRLSVEVARDLLDTPSDPDLHDRVQRALRHPDRFDGQYEIVSHGYYTVRDRLQVLTGGVWGYVPEDDPDEEWGDWYVPPRARVEPDGESLQSRAAAALEATNESAVAHGLPKLRVKLRGCGANDGGAAWDGPRCWWCGEEHVGALCEQRPSESRVDRFKTEYPRRLGSTHRRYESWRLRR